jgi:hypothetical protein
VNRDTKGVRKACSYHIEVAKDLKTCVSLWNTSVLNPLFLELEKDQKGGCFYIRNGNEKPVPAYLAYSVLRTPYSWVN